MTSVTKGQVISGEFGKILIRQKSDESLELGELLVSESGNNKILMQVFDLIYGSQISQQNLELISGMKLEENADTEFFDKNLRNYMLARLKNLVTIKNNEAFVSKLMPPFFSEVREIKKDDLSFLTKPENPFFIGNLRSGSKMLDVEIFLEGNKVLSHHILIAGTTGRGKSVLISNILWNLINQDYCGILVLDPHDEYFGRNKLGLKWLDEMDAVIIVLDATKDPYTQVNITIIGNLQARNIPVLIVANKSDLKKADVKKVQAAYPQYSVIGISAKYGNNIDRFYEGLFAIAG